MNDRELSETLKTAAKSVGDNIALQMLIHMKAARKRQEEYLKRSIQPLKEKNT